MGRLVRPYPKDYKQPKWEKVLLVVIPLVAVAIICYGLYKGW